MKYAFVTGASRGIGREVAKIFSKKQYFVFLSGRDLEELSQTQKQISESGGQSQIVQLDLLSLENIKKIPEILKNTTQNIDVLANIAGMYHDDERHFFGIPFDQYPDEAIINNINGILVGHILLTKYLVPFMKSGSSIVNMSGSFDDGETGVISDFMTKQGIEIFTKQLALELKEKNIRVNALRPGFVYTENVKKFFPEVKPHNVLVPEFVAAEVFRIAENTEITGQICRLVQ